MDIEEVKGSIENGLKAINEHKTMLEEKSKTLQKTHEELREKLDAFDVAKINKLAESVAGAAEAQEKLNTKAKADEEGRKAMQAQLDAIEKTLNRPGFGGGDKDDAKALAKKGTKLFNEFARIKADHTMSFDNFLDGKIAEDPELKALSVGSDPDGGYLVMPQFAGIIATQVYESSPIRQLASVTQIGTDSLEIVTDYDEAGASWVSETGTRSETSTPQFGKIDIPTHELYAEPKATQKMLDDGIIDIESWISQKVADQFARKEATAFVSGNGVGKPKGFLSYSAGTSVSAGQIEQVNSGSSTTITRTGLVNIQNSLKEPYQPNATWLAKRATLATIMELKNGIGDPIFDSMYDKNVGLELTIMGRPLRFANDMPAVNAGNLSMAYGDFRRGYQIVDRIGLRVLRDPYTAKPFVKFYTTKRVGGGVVTHEAIKLLKIAS